MVTQDLHGVLPVPAGATEVLEADLRGEQRGNAMGQGFPGKANGHQPAGKAASPPSPLLQPTPAERSFEAEGGNFSNAAGGSGVLSFQCGSF